MKQVMTGAAAGLASLVLLTASGEPADADLWIGLAGSQDGFLLDEATGEVWMTGACLRRLEPAHREGSAWVSRTREFVSVGRMTARLDQTFRLETHPQAPQISVYNPDRGGEQAFSDVELIACDTGACDRFGASPRCAD